MAELYDWKKTDVDEHGEFTPLEEPRPASSQTITERPFSFVRTIDRHPFATIYLTLVVLYCSGVLGQGRATGYYPIEPTRHSEFIGDGARGAEFLVPREESGDFLCGKTFLRFQRDKKHKRVNEIIPGENTIHVTCEGADENTPFKWPKEEKPSEPQTRPLPMPGDAMQS